jgi:hypothetical protein
MKPFWQQTRSIPFKFESQSRLTEGRRWDQWILIPRAILLFIWRWVLFKLLVYKTEWFFVAIFMFGNAREKAILKSYSRNGVVHKFYPLLWLWLWGIRLLAPIQWSSNNAKFSEVKKRNLRSTQQEAEETKTKVYIYSENMWYSNRNRTCYLQEEGTWIRDLQDKI